MYYMLCCDIATLRCSSAELERKIAEFSTRYHKLSDNLWLYCTPKDKTMQYFVAPEKYLVLYALQEYMTPSGSDDQYSHPGLSGSTSATIQRPTSLPFPGI